MQPDSPAAVVIPVRSLEGAKSRLGAVLDAEERRELVVRLLRRAISASIATPGVGRVMVVSLDPEALAIAAGAGAEGLRQTSAGLNGGLTEASQALAADGARRLFVVPGDLPGVSAAALALVLRAADDAIAAGADRGVVVLAPDRHGRGTNALLLDPPGVIDPAFGGDSRETHARLAAAAGAAYREVDDEALALDLDTPDDLLLAEALDPEVVRAG